MRMSRYSVRQRRRDDDVPEQLARLAPSVCAACISAPSTERVVLATISTIWKKVPMKMMVIFGSSPRPKTATASAPNTGAGM